MIANQAVASTQPGRFVEPTKTEYIVAFLAFDEASNVTGMDVNLAAGLWTD